MAGAYGASPPPHVLRRTASDGRLGTSGSGKSLRSSGQLMTQLQLPGGGRTHGAIIPHPSYGSRSFPELALACTGYDPRRHGWYDPRGMAESTRLSSSERLPDGSAMRGTWTWTMNKARNHIGAGQNGIITDTSSTMVSGDSPEWFTGIRTQLGPFNCKAVPVRRCPKNYIDGKTLRVQARTYEQGDCLDIIDHVQEGSRVQTPERRRPRKSEPHWRQEFKCPQTKDGRATSRPDTLEHGGCRFKAGPTVIPNTRVTRERFDCGSTVSAGKLTSHG